IRDSVGGLWINTSSIRFASLPTYYAIASTRPIDEIAEPNVRDANAIGFRHVPMSIASKALASGVTAEEAQNFREAIIRLKRKEGLYVSSDYGVAFIGRSLFRATVELPANVPVGPVKARVYLIRSGEVLSEAKTTVTLSRQGFELLMYNFAQNQPLLYGLFCVALAVGAGLLASTLFRKAGAH
ncbi:MAG: TIGR02186 family protein, partial [Hyphomicrobium sp.]